MRTLFELIPEVEPLAFVNIGSPCLFNDGDPLSAAFHSGGVRYTGFETVFPEGEEASPLVNRVPVVVGDGSEKSFYSTNSVFCSSLYEPDLELQGMFQNLSEFCGVQDEFRVKTERLDDLCANMSKVDFLRIDVQGSEMDCLRHAEKVLQNALYVEVKVAFVPIYKEQALWGDVDAFLRDRGFTFHCWDTPQGRCFKPLQLQDNEFGHIRQVLWTHARYVRHFEDFEKVEAKRLRGLAVLLHDILGSFDLACRALSFADSASGTDLAKRYLDSLEDGDE